jgi:hypothetical protein
MTALHVLTVPTVLTLVKAIAPFALLVTSVLITSLIAPLKPWLVTLALKGHTTLSLVALHALLVLMVSRVPLSLKLLVNPILVRLSCCVSAPSLAMDVLRAIGLMVLVPLTALLALPVTKAATVKLLPTERPWMLLA